MSVKDVRIHDSAWLRQRYAVDHATLIQIAEELGCSTRPVVSAMRRFGIESRDGAETREIRKRKESFPQLEDKDWLENSYLRERRAVADIAFQLGCPIGAVYAGLRRHGIPNRPRFRETPGRVSSRQRYPLLRDREWLAEKYAEGLSIEKIADIIGCSVTAAWKAFSVLGIERRDAYITRHLSKRGEVVQLKDVEWLKAQRIGLGRSVEDIAAEIGCAPGTVTKALWRWGIRLRKELPWDVPVEEKRLRKSNNGYVAIFSPDHPGRSRDGYVAEHRLVAEKELSRYLGSAEVVHHVNEKRDDNRPENLMVFPNNGTHMAFHGNPPDWVPRCECCGKPNPERLAGRPDHVPMLYA